MTSKDFHSPAGGSSAQNELDRPNQENSASVEKISLFDQQCNNLKSFEEIDNFVSLNDLNQLTIVQNLKLYEKVISYQHEYQKSSSEIQDRIKNLQATVIDRCSDNVKELTPEEVSMLIISASNSKIGTERKLSEESLKNLQN